MLENEAGAEQRDGPAGDRVEVEEERLTGERLRGLVLEENERLNRLIRNLYLKFRLESYPEAELFDHVCRELAQYFHTDICSLFLVRYENTEEGLTPWLELVGAFGPWQEALQPKNTRQKLIVRYSPDDLKTATAQAYHRTQGPADERVRIPTLLPSRQSFELLREAARRLGREKKLRDLGGQGRRAAADPAKFLVWRYSNLYTTCRNVIMVPVTRQPESGLPPVGLLRIENRTPRGTPGYNLTAGPRQLFFHDLWALAALQPYLNDLADSPDVFTPIHNNEAWRLRYQDNPLGLEYFDSLREWLKAEREKAANGDAEGLKKKIQTAYQSLRDKLNVLLRFLAEAEPLLQNMAYAHAVLTSVEAPDGPLRNDGAGRATGGPHRGARHPRLHPDTPPAPSFFNAHNLALALRKAEEEEGMAAPSPPTDPDVLRRLLPLADAIVGENKAQVAVGREEVKLKDCSPSERQTLRHLIRRKLLMGPGSVGARLRDLLKEKGVVFPEENGNRAGEAWPRLVTEVRRKLVPDEVLGKRSIAPFLGPEVPWDFKAALRDLLGLVGECAQRLAGARLPDRLARPGAAEERGNGEAGGDAGDREAVRRLWPSDTVQARVLTELREAHQLAEEIVQGGEGLDACLESTRKTTAQWLKAELQWLAGEESRKVSGGLARAARELVTEEAVQLLLLSRWSAQASMGAHTFNTADAYRLMFIAGHLCQVLDTNLMQQARQRNIPGGYSDFALLGLDRDSLEWLSDLANTAVQVAQRLTYLLNRDWRRRGGDQQVRCKPLDLGGDLFAPIRTKEQVIRDNRRRRQPRAAPVGVNLITIHGPLPPEPSPTLDILRRWGHAQTPEGAGSPPILRAFSEAGDPPSLAVTIPVARLGRPAPEWLLHVCESLQALQEDLRDA